MRRLLCLSILSLFLLTACRLEALTDDTADAFGNGANVAAADRNAGSGQEQANATTNDLNAGNTNGTGGNAGDAGSTGNTGDAGSAGDTGNATQNPPGIPPADSGDDTNGGQMPPPTPPNTPITIGNCATNTYVGDLHGLQATARLVIEPLPNYTYVEGEIRSDAAYYTFTAEIIGDRGWGDMLDHLTLERFRVQFDVAPNGFYLTANPFLAPTTYLFACQ